MAQAAPITPFPAPRSGNLERWIPRYRRALRQANASDRTVAIYVGAVTHLHEWLRTHVDEDSGLPMPLDIEEITRDHLRQFFIDMADNGYVDHRNGERKPYLDSTINNRYRSLQQFFRWLEPPAPDDKHGDDWGEDVIAASPFGRMRPPKVTDKPVPVIPEAALERLLGTKKARTLEDRRDLAIMLMFIDNGVRCGGMASMTVNKLNLDDRLVDVVVKGGGTRTIGFGHSTAKALDRYLDLRERATFSHLPNLWISRFGRFTTDGIRQMVTRACREAGIEHIHPHQFRHTFAHHKKVAGVTDDELMRLMGWKSRQMTIRYGESAADERAREAYRNSVSPADRLRIPR